MNENEINDGDSYYLLETTEGFVKIKNPTYYIAKYSYEDLQAAVLAEREACAKLCEEREEYSMQIPCPDGIVGCGVFHTVRGSNLKDGRECAAAIRGRTE
jgi:hypothetical protein